jgi:ATP-dependent DNA ligase
VCEVAYDQLDDHRFRHPARFRRWRPDRDASSCLLTQLDLAAADVRELLPA